MGKKLGVGLLIVAGLAAGGVWTYRRYEATKPKTLFPGEAGTVVAPHESEPAGGGPAGKPESASPGGVKGASSGAVGFQPRTGETLDFIANVPKLNSAVANLRVKVGERRNVEGKDAWHLQVFAHTENPYRMVFELDDEFDSYSEYLNLASLKYEMHLNERGQKVDTVERLTSSSREPAPANEVAARVLPGTRDPIGMLMYLRSVDWGNTREVKSPVFDGHKLYDVRAVLVGKSQSVTVAAGKIYGDEDRDSCDGQRDRDEGRAFFVVPGGWSGAVAGVDGSGIASGDGAGGVGEGAVDERTWPP